MLVSDETRKRGRAGARLGDLAGATATLVGYNLRRGLGVPARRLEQAAAKSWDIAPGVDEPQVPIYIPESHFARIQAHAPPYEAEPVASLLDAIRKERHQGAPTRAYLLRNAVLFRQHVYCGLYRGDLYATLGLPAVLRSETAEIQSGVLATTYSGARWFAHFLYDDVPLQELASGVGRAVGHLRPIYRHEPGWRAALGVPAPATYAALRARELVWIDDCGQNVAKRRRFQALRSRLQHLPAGHEQIFLRRNPFPAGEERQISNIAEVEARLVREGFHPVDTGQVSVEEMLARCMRASIVVSVEGSHAAPAYYFAREGACLLFLYPPRRVSVLMPRLAGFFGQAGAMFIGEPPAENDSGGNDSQFYVDPDELAREIERAAAFAAAQTPL